MSSKTFLIGRASRKYQGLNALRPRWLTSAQDIRHALRAGSHGDLWIVLTRRYLEAVLRNVDWPPARKLGDLLVLDSVRCQFVEALHSLFYNVVLTSGRDTPLPPEELVEVLRSQNKRDLFLSGMLDEGSQTLTLWRGDLSRLVVPLSAFPPTAQGTSPDWERFEIADYGQTLRFGDYEAASDAVLYEYDGDYRRRLSRLRRSKDKGFGPSLRRLRKQKGLRREDFPPLSARTIARMERGEVGRPHKRTLRILAEHLGVPPEAIETY